MKNIFMWFAAGFAEPVNAVAQIVGFIPVILAYFVFVFNDRKKIIVFKASSDLLWALHFLLLGEMTGCIINIINVIRNIIFSQRNRKWLSGSVIPILFCGITAIATLLSWDGVKSIFPLVGSCLAVVGFWCNDTHDIRKYNLPAVSLWLIYGLITGSVSTIVCNLMSVSSILSAELKVLNKK